MDISETYIKMCEKAEEIQKLRPRPNESEPDDYLYTSFFFNSTNRHIEILKWDNDEDHPIIGGYGDRGNTFIWLPRQDQLQEMIEYVSHRKEAVNFAYWINDLPGVYSWSMEQLWLSYVMKTKYNEAWNGTNWIEEQ